MLAFALRKHNQEDKLLWGGVWIVTRHVLRHGTGFFPQSLPSYLCRGFASCKQLKLEVLVAFEEKYQG